MRVITLLTEEAVKERPVIEKGKTKLPGNGKDAMPVLNIEEFKRHRSSPVNGVHVAVGRTEAGMTTERNKFKVTAERTAIHGTAKGRISSGNHFFYILNDRVTRVLNIKHFFKMVVKDSL